MKNLLSVDFEDWFHFIGSKYTPRIEDWGKLASRIELSTEAILKAIHPHRATFFCLGWAAERFPATVRRIVSEGHDIGSHGYHHELVYKLGPDKFREDIARTKELLQSITGTPVTAYRAPGFSITPQADWAFDIIYETGHRLDSSVFPGLRTMGGIPDASPYPGVLETRLGTLMEIPVSTVELFNKRTAFCGGGFFRFFPYHFIAREIRRLNSKGIPAAVYIHLRDIDSDQPRLKLEPVNSFMYHYGLSSAYKKFQRLLADFQWESFQTYAERMSPAGQ